MAGTYFKDNELLKALEKSEAYKSMKKVIEAALVNQWQDILLSGVVNDFFDRYKEFFVRKPGQKIKIRKADGTVSSIEDLQDQETETLQGNRLLVPEKALNMVPLLLFLNNKIDKNMYSVSAYYNFKNDMNAYLKSTANKAGQSVIDTLSPEKALKFRLSKKEYTDKIKQRVNTLVTGLDNTTKKRLTNQLVEGIRLGETKTELVKRVTKAGAEISANRAKRIVATETQSINEYIRYETARVNGVETKIWATAEDERVCQTCEPLNGIEKKMGEYFESMDFTDLYPPAHTTCRCWIEYRHNPDVFVQFIDLAAVESLLNDEDALSEEGFFESVKTMADRVDVVEKKSKGDSFYEIGDSTPVKFVNPKAIWAGGESLVGSDKEVGNFSNAIKQYPGYADEVRSLLNKDDGVMWIDNKRFLPSTSVARNLYEARKKLSDVGFIQLLLSLGVRRKIIPKSKKLFL